MFDLDRKSKVNKALIQRCVDKGLIDGNYLQRSLDTEMMDLARRLFEQPDYQSSDDDKPDKKANEVTNDEEGGVVLVNVANSETPFQVKSVGEVKERD